MTTSGDDPWLWLFSSNRRALYAQDVSNIAALPEGARYTFRYRRVWVGNGARAAWEADKLASKSALIVFSLQHRSHMHPPAFVPARVARVLGSEPQGTALLVTFEVGEYANLGPHARDGDSQYPTLGQRIRDFTTAVEPLLKEGRPGGDPDKSAVFGDTPSDLIGGSPPAGEAWERVVEYLVASGSFPEHLFFRVIGLKEMSGEEIALSDGVYEVTAGQTYELLLAHYQPEPFTVRRHLQVVTDEDVLDVEGSTTLTVASGYDAMRVRFNVQYRDEPKDVTIAVEPGPGEEGSRVELTLRIKPPGGEKVVRTTIGALALLLAALPGVWKDFDGLARLGAAGAIIVGGGLTGWLTARSRVRLRRRPAAST